MITVRTDGKDLLDSKSFLALGLGETSISLTSETETLHFVFDFYEDEKEKEQKLEFELINDSTLRVKLTNYSNPLGTTWNQPAEIGSFNKRKLYLLPYVKKAGSLGNVREVLVCFYLGEGVRQDGQD